MGLARRISSSTAVVALVVSILPIAASQAMADDNSFTRDEQVQITSGEAISNIDESTSAPFIEADSQADAEAKLRVIKRDPSGGLSARSANTKYGPCWLKADSFHSRTSSGHKYGGFKSTTYCTSKVSSIHHTSTSRYKKLLWWFKAGSPISKSAKASELLKGGSIKIKIKGKNVTKHYPLVWTQKNVEVKCKNKKKTNWSGRVVGKITYKGKTYYADAYAPPRKDPCGY